MRGVVSLAGSPRTGRWSAHVLGHFGGNGSLVPDIVTELAWPEWWDWEIEFTPHLLKRMEDRDFSDVDVRRMRRCAKSHIPDIVEGRWVIKTEHNDHPWEIIVEPDDLGKFLVVITACPVWCH